MNKIVLYGQPASTYVRTARMCCIEADVDYELREFGDSMETVMAALKSPENLARHPFGRMPSLVDGETTAFEGSAIGHYVSSIYGNGCLVPEDKREAVIMEQWVSAANCYIIPDTVQKFIFRFVFNDEPDMEEIDKDKPLLRSHYEALDRALEGKTRLAGGKITIADLLLAPPLHYVGNMPGGMDLFDGLSNLGRWWEAISSRESFKETLPPMMAGDAEAA